MCEGQRLQILKDLASRHGRFAGIQRIKARLGRSLSGQELLLSQLAISSKKGPPALALASQLVALGIEIAEANVRRKTLGNWDLLNNG